MGTSSSGQAMSDIQADKDPWRTAEGATPIPGASLPSWIARPGQSLLTDRRRTLKVLLSLFLGCVAWRLLQTINNDIAWYIYSANELLDGGHPYRDIYFEVNPPLMLYLTVPPVWLARLLDVFPVPVYYLYIFSILALSLVLCQRVLLGLPNLSPPARRGLVLAGFVFLAIGPAGDFGQREHVMVILALPYLLLVAARARDTAYAPLLTAAIGIAAALGFAIKPHFLLVPVALEIYLVWRRRGFDRLFRIETVALALTGVLYGAALVLFTPDYLTTIVPYAFEVYNAAYRNTFAIILARQETVLLPALVILHLYFRARQKYKDLTDVLVLSGLCYFVAYLAQMKGFNYQIYPTTAMIFLALAAALAGMVETLATQPAAGPAADRSSVVTFPLAILLLAASLLVHPLLSPGNRFVVMEILGDTVRRHGAGSPFYFFSSNTWTAFPMVNYLDLQWSSRFSGLWLIPGVQMKRRNPTAGQSAEERAVLDELDRFTREAVIADLTRSPPKVIVVDGRSEKQWYDFEFDFIAFFSRDPRFVDIWSHYELIEESYEFQIFRRCETPCAGQVDREL